VRWLGCVAPMGDIVSLYNILLRKLEGGRPLWKTKSKWDNIEIVVG
jgi:hypothetical protein